MAFPIDGSCDKEPNVKVLGGLEIGDWTQTKKGEGGGLREGGAGPMVTPLPIVQATCNIALSRKTPIIVLKWRCKHAIVLYTIKLSGRMHFRTECTIRQDALSESMHFQTRCTYAQGAHSHGV